eukprot:365346-Chlamydomonas_euryale.AAC.2
MGLARLGVYRRKPVRTDIEVFGVAVCQSDERLHSAAGLQGLECVRPHQPANTLAQTPCHAFHGATTCPVHTYTAVLALRTMPYLEASWHGWLCRAGLWRQVPGHGVHQVIKSAWPCVADHPLWWPLELRWYGVDQAACAPGTCVHACMYVCDAACELSCLMRHSGVPPGCTTALQTALGSTP